MKHVAINADGVQIHLSAVLAAAAGLGLLVAGDSDQETRPVN